MRILVTGATGFLGGRLCRHLQAQGHYVIALGRDREKGAQLAASGMAFHALDLADPAAADRPPPTGAVDAVVHSAALSSAWGAPAAFRAANVTGTQTALHLAGRLEARRFIHISSPSVLFRFADQFAVNEAAALPKPVNAYAQTKALAEGLVLAASHLNPLVLRPRGIYGPGDVALLPRLMRAARRGPLPLLRDGVAETDLTHVDDVVQAIVCALAAPLALKSRIFHVSGGEPLPVRRIVDMAAASTGIAVRWRALPLPLIMAVARAAERLSKLRSSWPEPVITTYGVGVLAFTQTLDIRAARSELGFHPKISFAMGLKTIREAP